MKNRRRKIFLVFMLILVMTMISACGKKEPAKSETTDNTNITNTVEPSKEVDKVTPTESSKNDKDDNQSGKEDDNITVTPVETPEVTGEASPEATESPEGTPTVAASLTPTATQVVKNTPTPTPTKKPVKAESNTPTPTPTPSPTPSKTPTPSPSPVPTSKYLSSDASKVNSFSFTNQSIPNNSALNFIAGMTVGVNIGNGFDAVDCTWLSNELDYESAWCGSKCTTKFIDSLCNQGINTVRIPVSYKNHVNSNYQISTKWLARVKEVADYAYGKGMYVIINVHHDVDKNYYYPDDEHYEQSSKYMKAVWEQIANYFSGYGEKLIFESINEPRLVGTANGIEWGYQSGYDFSEAVNNIVKLNQDFVDTVRATGGNNATRYLMVPSYDTSVGFLLHNSFSLPKDTVDNKIIVTAHMYSPYSFAQDTNGTKTFGTSQKNENKNDLERLYNKFVKNGVPVYIGEFGCIDKDNSQARADYFSYFISCAKSYGIRAAYWDNNAFRVKGSTGYDNKFGLIDRASGEVIFPNIIKSMTQYFK